MSTIKPTESRPKPKTGSRTKIQYRTSSGTYTAKLTRKQKAFADMIISQPKTSATEIVRQTYAVSDTNTAKSIASENLTKPNILLYLNKHIDKAQEVITGFMDLKDSENIQEKRLAYDSATQIIDRVAGKPTQIQQSQSISFIQHLSNKHIDI